MLQVGQEIKDFLEKDELIAEKKWGVYAKNAQTLN